MTRITVDRDPAGAGHALLRVAGAATAAADPRFQIMYGEGDAPNLGPRGWQAPTALLEPLEARAEAGNLLLRVGPEVVDHMEPGPALFALPAAGIAEEMLLWPGHILTSGAGIPVASSPVPPVRESAPNAPAPSPPAPVQEGARPAPPRPKRPWLVPTGLGLAGFLLLCALGGAGAWYYWHHLRHAPPPKPASTANQHVVPPPAQAKILHPNASPAPVQKVAAPGPAPTVPACAMGTVAQVIACAKTPDALAAAGQARWAADPNAAFLILQSAVDRNSGSAAYFLAQQLDPNGFHAGAGPIPKPEPREAARDYRIAACAGVPGAAGRRAALRAWLETQAKAGDAMASLTLHDFWSKPCPK